MVHRHRRSSPATRSGAADPPASAAAPSPVVPSPGRPARRGRRAGPSPVWARAAFVALAALLWAGWPPGAAAQTCSSNGCVIDMSPPTYVLNNHWNTAGAYYVSQSSTVTSPTSWSTSWDMDRPEEWTVTTYAAAILGWHWGWRYPASQTGLPVQISSRTPINASVAFNLVPDGSCGVSRTCRFDIAYDVWFHTTSDPGTSTPAHEMMIWLAYSRDLFVGYPIAGSATLGGHRWKVIKATATYTAFVLDEPADLTGATLNIMEFAGWLADNLGMPNSWWLDSVQFGPEIYKGKGTLNMTYYAVTVGGAVSSPQGPTSSPPPAGTVASSATATPNPVAPGQGVSITGQVTAGTSLSNAVVDLEIYDAAGGKVAQQYYTGQNLTAGTPRSYTWAWPGTGTTGQYSIRMGVFSGDWSTLYGWNGSAGAFSVQSAGAALPLDFTLSASASPDPVAPGQPVGITAKVSSTAAVSNAIVDVEIYDAADVKIAQQVYSGQSFTAGTTRSYTWNWGGAAAAGQYSIRMGVFSADWSTLHEWNAQAGAFSVQAAQTAPTFSVSGSSVSPGTARNGQTVTIKASVKSSGAVYSIPVDLELFNGAGQKVAQYVCTLSFSAGQTKTCSWSYPVQLPKGTYRLNVGIFSPDWSTLYKWVATGARLTVN